MIDMKKKLLIVLLASLFQISCRKDTNDNSHLLAGKWHWKSSLEDNGTQMLPRDSSATDSNFVVFNSVNFTNHAGCVIGGPSEGSFEVQSISNKQILILKSPYTIPDTFAVNITNTQLELTEVFSNYSWTHTFIKRSNE
jgi:hypothetical protein